MNKRYRIKSKFRFTIFLTLVIVMIILTAGTVVGANEALSLTKPVYTEVQIISGDTLWDLAKEYGPNDRDVRKVIHAICEINDISADDIQPGQSILIPQYL